MHLSSRVSVLALSVAVAAACSSGGEGVASDEANVTEGCEVLSAKDGHTLTQSELAALGDPVANLILQGQGCPKNIEEINAKLVVTDTCGTAPPEPGLATRFVSERTLLLDTPDEYRTVISRRCGGRQVYELLMSVFVHAGPGGSIDTARVNGDSVELIGEKRDATNAETASGVFNFYARERGKWTFFGSSDDFVSQGYDCNADGACIPKAAQKQRCAGCHVGGGLIMKELESPWTFWEPSRAPPMPGVKELVAKFPHIFGARTSGTELEVDVVRPGNDEWSAARLNVLEKQGLKEVLRPLFCSLDMNMEAASVVGAEVGVPIPNVINDHLVIDPIWPRERSVRIARNSATDDAMAAINQRIVDSATNKAFTLAGETMRGFSIPAPGALSIAHRERLVEAGIVDMDLVKDILAVDMTRPLYSKARCELLDRVPNLPAAEMQPARIKAAIAQALDGATSAGAELRANLLDPSDEAAHDAAARSFLETCVARQKTDPAGFATDFVQYSAQVRKALRRAGGIIETSEMLATDDLPEHAKAFDLTTCKLK